MSCLGERIQKLSIKKYIHLRLGKLKLSTVLRLLILLCLALIMSTLVILFQLAKTNGNFNYWHIQGFAISCSACLCILIITYYARAQRNRAKKANDEKYRSIIAISNMGVWELHPETGYLWCSPEYFQMLGYDKQSFLIHHAMTIEAVWINRLHPDDRQVALEKFAAFSSGGSNLYENTFRLKHRKGNWIWILSRSKALQKGRLRKVLLGSHIDITEKILTQLELRRRNQKLMNFSFSNAHHVRGPVARMLGLVELSRIDTERHCEWYVNKICNEVEELDKIIKSIARELDEIDEV